MWIANDAAVFVIVVVQGRGAGTVHHLAKTGRGQCMTPGVVEIRSLSAISNHATLLLCLCRPGCSCWDRATAD